MERIPEREVPTGHFVSGFFDQRLPEGQLLKLSEQGIGLNSRQRPAEFVRSATQRIGQTVFVRGNEVQDLGIERRTNTIVLVEPEYPTIFLGVFVKNAPVDLVGVDRVLCFTHCNAIFQHMRRLWTIVLFLEVRDMTPFYRTNRLAGAGSIRTQAYLRPKRPSRTARFDLPPNPRYSPLTPTPAPRASSPAPVRQSWRRRSLGRCRRRR